MEDDHRAAALQHRKKGSEHAVSVEHRHRQQAPFVGPVEQRPAQIARRPFDGGVGQEHSLGNPGRARRIGDIGDIGIFDGGLYPLRRLPGKPLVVIDGPFRWRFHEQDVLEVGDLIAQPGRLFHEIGGREQHLGPAIGHDVDERVVMGPRRGRGDRGAGAQRPQERFGETVIVLDEDGDVVSFADAERLEAVGDLVRAVLERGIGDAVLTVDQSLLVRPNS